MNSISDNYDYDSLDCLRLADYITNQAVGKHGWYHKN
jgi:hypothetical protein